MRAFLGWDSDRMTGEYPWLRIAWNFLWFVPIMAFRFGFVLCVGMGHGKFEMKRAWRQTE